MENILFDKKDHIATITINRPKALNALNTNTLDELDSLLDEIENDEDIYVLIITGEGRSFIAGADIAEMVNKTKEEAEIYGVKGNDVFRKIEKLHCPVIAKVNGFALGGGCELACACDIRIASEKALFGQPEVGLGITPGFGGTQRLQRLIGLGKAKEMIYCARNIKADEALRIGLVNSVYKLEELDEEVNKLAKIIASNAPKAVSFSKKAIDSGREKDIEDAVKYEEKYFAECFTTSDQKNGMKAFLNKEKFEFENK